MVRHCRWRCPGTLSNNRRKQGSRENGAHPIQYVVVSARRRFQTLGSARKAGEMFRRVQASGPKRLQRAPDTTGGSWPDPYAVRFGQHSAQRGKACARPQVWADGPRPSDDLAPEEAGVHSGLINFIEPPQRTRPTWRRCPACPTTAAWRSSRPFPLRGVGRAAACRTDGAWKSRSSRPSDTRRHCRTAASR